MTAIGYQGGSAGSVASRSARQRRRTRGCCGGSGTRSSAAPRAAPRWYQLPGGQGPATSALDVGARRRHRRLLAGRRHGPVGSANVVLDGRDYGARIDIQPTGAPSLVVSVSHITIDPSLVVGSPLTAAGSKLGSIVDFSGAEHQSLARYTNDSGNHVVDRGAPGGDVVARLGSTPAAHPLRRRRLRRARPPSRRGPAARAPRPSSAADFCIVNGENAAAGRGITAKLADRLLAAGADVVTLGNWTWGQAGFAPYLSGTDRVLRPANMSPRRPARGLAVHDGVAVISLLGVFALDPFESPFLAADRLVEEARRADPGRWSSTSTRRRRARRSRWRATSTVA